MSPWIKQALCKTDEWELIDDLFIYFIFYSHYMQDRERSK